MTQTTVFNIQKPVFAAVTAGILTFGAIASSCSKTAATEEYYIKEVVFPANAAIEQKIDMASRLVPTDKQMEWQRLGLTAFLHFGVNTFTDREWGDGTEDEAIFNPTKLDTDQWVKTLKDAGFRMVILTAKHHDGFCLWPTATTGHSVKNSPWLDGQGDVVRMLSESCRKYGMKLGLYLSPWDRNAECYGDSPKYNDMFVAQLTELLSNYGKVDEVWFDGACGEGPNGKKQEYDWARFKETIERLQPEAVMAIMGDDVRWVGNEGGKGRETEWSATAIMPGILPGSKAHNDSIGVNDMSKDLGSRDLLAKTDRLFWWPSEVDVSIRPGWFYHETEEPRSLHSLATIYPESVGRNSVLLLNIPPDREGLINEKDVKRLGEFRQWIDSNFADNLAAETGSLRIGLKPGSIVNTVELAEDITRGQRVEEFTVSALTPDGWKQVAEGTTIGYKRLLTFNDVSADSIAVDITSYRGKSHNASVTGAYRIAMPKGEAYTPSDIVKIDMSKATTTGYYPAADMFDGNETTVASATQGTPLVIDLGSNQTVAAFSYLPPQDSSNGSITNYEVYIATSPDSWQKMDVSGEFSNIVNNPIEQYVRFGNPVNTRYLKLVPIELAVGSDSGKVRVAEFNVFKPASEKAN